MVQRPCPHMLAMPVTWAVLFCYHASSWTTSPISRALCLSSLLPGTASLAGNTLQQALTAGQLQAASLSASKCRCAAKSGWAAPTRSPASASIPAAPTSCPDNSISQQDCVSLTLLAQGACVPA